MKRIIQLLIIAALALPGLPGCVNDRGDYDYKDIPEFVSEKCEVSVNGKTQTLASGNKIVVETNDLLHITLNGHFTKEVSPEYRWMIFPKTQQDNSDHIFEQAREIAATQDFDQPFTEAPGTYILYFEAKNTVDNTLFHHLFEVEVLSLKGMLVYYTDAEGKGDYGAVTTAELFPDIPADKLGQNKDIYSAINEEKIDRPTQIWVRMPAEQRKEFRRILLASENTVTVVNYETHEKESDNYNSLFVIPPEKEALPQGFNNGFQCEHLIQNGDLCRYDYMGGSLKPLFGLHMGTPGCEYSPYIMNLPYLQGEDTGGESIVFNETMRGFECDYYGFLMPFMSVGGDVDISATGMELLYVDKGVGKTIHAVMLDDDGHLHYVCFEMNLNMDMYAYEGLCTRDLDLSGSEAGTMSCWAIAARGDFAYFSSGTEVYLLNHAANTVTPMNLGLPVGAEITALQVLKDPDNIVYDNALLFVAYNLNGEGTLLQYRFNGLSGAINSGSKKEFSGFGKILGIALKK